MRKIILLAFFGLVVNVICGQTVKPNIVFVIADDLGRNDLGCYGNRYIETPNLDLIAKRSFIFDEAYAAAPVCSPSRASILTGQYPARLGITNFIDGRRVDDFSPVLPANYINYLPSGLITMPKVFRESGYHTAIIGKWHLGENTRPNDSHPLNHGFDLALHHDYGLVPDNESYVWIKGIDTLGSRYRLPELTSKITSDAIQYLDSVSQPFLLFVTHYNPHLPLQPVSNLLNKYLQKSNPYNNLINPKYAAMVEELDIEVGKIWNKLEQKNLLTNTIFIFISDNGGVVVDEAGDKQPTIMLPFRNGKGTLFEGGIKIPQIIYHPKITKSQRIQSPTSTIDFLATLTDLCNIPKPNYTADGESFSSLFQSKFFARTNPLFWHYPHFSNQGGRPSSAIRDGNFKLILSLETQEILLFDLKNDIGEKENLAGRYPVLTQKLKNKLNVWYGATKALMPQPKN